MTVRLWADSSGGAEIDRSVEREALGKSIDPVSFCKEQAAESALIYSTLTDQHTHTYSIHIHLTEQTRCKSADVCMNIILT